MPPFEDIDYETTGAVARIVIAQAGVSITCTSQGRAV
jgi:hypothetical protein